MRKTSSVSFCILQSEVCVAGVVRSGSDIGNERRRRDKVALDPELGVERDPGEASVRYDRERIHDVDYKCFRVLKIARRYHDILEWISK